MIQQRGSLRRRIVSGAVAVFAALTLVACGSGEGTRNLAVHDEGDDGPVVNFFSPMEKVSPDAENTARTASDQTIAMAEQALGLTVAYRTYTAEDYQDKTYDEVCLDRVRSARDDLYLLNSDVIVALGSEGKLADLSGLSSAQNLREEVRVSNTVDGKLVAIPQEVVAYGLFVNKDIFKECGLALPSTPDEFLAACRVLKEKGYDVPLGANRWWLETFVFAQAYADLYNGGDIEAEVAALNAGEARYSDYMRPGFEFLKKLVDAGYIDAGNALRSEAFEGAGEGADFMAGKSPMVVAYWGAANTDTAYGNPSFAMEVIGFPSERGPMPVLSMTGYGVASDAEHGEEALAAMDVMLSDEALRLYAETNRVISPSKNVVVDCAEPLRPLNDLVQADTYVLASNAAMDVEQWGNVCLIVRDLLAGASVDECMAKLDALQDAALAA
ncbi:ABC transporter substrate-binding protein [Adlercreutzia caecimuris]|uniref:Extracellular solute-binding protein n=1 Tax=Adlercreutzia caecimuris B7 TaxID=1235794 RepID=R9L1K6_9ACTN|nr:extracellular solute-binding protein [Adlercreutzia caecimuris]EOS52291.1 hypothetical protein C811_00314 [Adlercreutzia caecimuris B7]